jgi:hypothetical protein
MESKKNLKKRVKELELLLEQKDQLIKQLLNELDNKQPQVIPYFGNSDNLCTDGKPHEYPMPWHSLSPAPCKKCGKLSEQYPITYYDTGNPPWDFKKHGGNVMNSPNIIDLDNTTKFSNIQYDGTSEYPEKFNYSGNNWVNNFGNYSH